VTDNEYVEWCMVGERLREARELAARRALARQVAGAAPRRGWRVTFKALLRVGARVDAGRPQRAGGPASA
jgi:hypothetical protein